MRGPHRPHIVCVCVPPPLPCRPSPLVGDGLLCRDPLVLLYLHQPRHQLLGWGQGGVSARGPPAPLACPPPSTGAHPPARYRPSRAGRTRSPRPGFCGRGSCRGSRSHPRPPPRRRGGSPRGCAGRCASAQRPPLPPPCPPCPARTHRMYMMTPIAQQSTGRPYRCRPTTSGAAGHRRVVGGQVLSRGPQQLWTPGGEPPGPGTHLPPSTQQPGADPLLWLLTQPWEQGEGAMGAPRMGPWGAGQWP